LVFEEVHNDLENEGYEVQSVVLPAASVNAPHRRDRVWFVAYYNCHVHEGGLDYRGNRGEAETSKGADKQQGGWSENRQRIRSKLSTSGEDAADTECLRQQRSREYEQQMQQKEGRIGETSRSYCGYENNRRRYERPNFDSFPTQPPVCSRNDGISDSLDSIPFSKWRQESIKAYGNAIVPQVVYPIFKAIQIIDNDNERDKQAISNLQ